MRISERTKNRSADQEFSYGTALAMIGRLDEAQQAFIRGRSLRPLEPRFVIELAGVAFKQKQYRAAEKWLLKAEALSPEDDYVQDFLGTVYFLQNQLEAALKHWNRIDKPYIENVRIDPTPSVDPVLLDRAIAFSPAAIMQRDQLLVTEARLNALGIFPRRVVELVARAGGRFDASIHVQERNGFGAGTWEALLSTFRGLPFQMITPEYYNVRGTATNVSSLWRWDAQKRRVFGALSAPLRRSPKLRYQLGVDLRNENWDVRNFSKVGGAQVGTLNMRRSAGSVGVTVLQGPRWRWSTGAEVSYRDFRNVSTDPGFTPASLGEGYQLKHTAALTIDLLRLPEKRFAASATVSSAVGRVFANDGPAFAKAQAAVSQRWLMGNGEDWDMQHQIGFGATAGSLPFNELFMLGVERDNTLLMRGHAGTRDGRKGNAPLGSNYFLSNWELDRKLWSNGLVAVKLGPFVDTGRITDPIASLGAEKWLWDAGGQAKLSVLGIKFGVSYGRDLRAGRGAWFAWVGK